MAMKRKIINLKYKILMKKPRMEVTVKRVKRMKLDVLEEVSKDMHWLNKNEKILWLYEDIQSLQYGGM